MERMGGMKRLACFMLIGLLCSSTRAYGGALEQPTLYQAGELLELTSPALLAEGKTWVPLWEILAEMHCVVEEKLDSIVAAWEWGGALQTLAYQRGAPVLTVTGVPQGIPVMFLDGTTYVPLRELYEQFFHYQITYRVEASGEKKIYLYSQKPFDTEAVGENLRRGFTLKLADQLPDLENAVISPLSLKWVLGMLLNGTSGPARVELQQALGIPMDAPAGWLRDYNAQSAWAMDQLCQSGESMTVISANAVWMNPEAYPDLTWNPAYLETIRQYYRGEVLTTDAKNAMQQINGWVSRRTAGSIPRLLECAEWNMALLNTIYLKGAWLLPFFESGTAAGPFYNADGTVSEADFMHQTESYLYYENVIDDVQAATLAYRPNRDAAGSSMRMTLILSEAPVTEPMLEDIMQASQKRWLNLYIPKFKQETQWDLAAMLMEMGVSNIFTAGEADFSAMFASGGSVAQFDDAVQKVCLSVNEEGTEAAAATSFGRMQGDPMEQPIDFTANRPFMYLIWDSATGEIIFIGKCNTMAE